jgi:cellulose synthase/poly-beta-1,6-N-acetylglucosamine synthase-like glycosyltransferase
VLNDWTHWLSSLHPDQLLAFLGALLLTDGPRYALSKILLCLGDWGRDVWRGLLGTTAPRIFRHHPSVCAIIAGHNEEETIESTLLSLWGTYPWLEIIVVDDGSTDDMMGAARRFARTHEGVKVLRRPERGGKSSAMNWGLSYTRAEIIVIVDADSHLGPAAVWELVQPFEDPHVGAVAGAVLARNPFASLATWLQAYEYLSTIFIGRMVAAKLHILGIVSGAMGAFRRSALDQVGGWDVGPPEDLDLTLTVRKLGYGVAFAPYAECYTELPTTWRALIRQRLRWERSGAIRNHCRKHLDLAFPWAPNFRLANLFTVMESWFFNIFCTYAICAWFVWFFVTWPDDWWKILLVLYLCYLTFEIIQILAGLYYTNAPWRDMMIYAVFFLVPAYQLTLLVVRLVATTEEIFLRKSFQDNYVPQRVRDATWHW